MRLYDVFPELCHVKKHFLTVGNVTLKNIIIHQQAFKILKPVKGVAVRPVIIFAKMSKQHHLFFVQQTTPCLVAEHDLGPLVARFHGAVHPLFDPNVLEIDLVAAFPACKCIGAQDPPFDPLFTLLDALLAD